MSEQLSTMVYKKLQQDIVTGAIPDKYFFSESELAERYGVSKTPVKNAIHRLCQEGYIVGYPRKGYMVNIISPEELKKMNVVRTQLELLAVNLAVREATDEDIQSLKDIISNRKEELDPYKTSNTEFHMQLARVSHNEYLVEILPRFLAMVSRAGIKCQKKFDVESHSKIVDALEKRDAQKASQCLLEDLAEKFW